VKKSRTDPSEKELAVAAASVRLGGGDGDDDTERSVFENTDSQVELLSQLRTQLDNCDGAGGADGSSDEGNDYEDDDDDDESTAADDGTDEECRLKIDGAKSVDTG
jgi:hypothetical protein